MSLPTIQRVTPLILSIWLFFGLLLTIHPAKAAATNRQRLQNLIGQRDSIVVADMQGNIIFEKNAGRQLVPASTLKILTSLAALMQLGPGYKFMTDFYLDPHTNLKVKGYGDPLLVSEVLNEIACNLSTKLTYFNDLQLDGSHFQDPLTIPGIADSFQPYDAPNGALCVNFNTVYFKRLADGSYTSAEPQTPLLPFVLARIKASALNSDRILLSSTNAESIYYSGHLLNFFLKQNGICSSGSIKLKEVDPAYDRLIYRHVSRFPIEQVVAKLLEFSNNFMSNQILIACGIDRYGPPGTLPKGTRFLTSYTREILNLDGFTIAEGSGISRDNRISADAMITILNRFAPYHHLLRRKGREFYKTGHLAGISTRVGYIKSDKGVLFRYVVFINTPGKSAQSAMKHIYGLIDTSAK